MILPNDSIYFAAHSTPDRAVVAFQLTDSTRQDQPMPRRSTPNVSIAAERYVAFCYQRGGSDQLRKAQRSLFRRFAAAMNDRQMGSLVAEDIDEFFYGDGGLAESCARTTLGKYHGDVKGFLLWCFRRDWCDDPQRLLGGVVHTSTRSNRVRLRLSEAQMWSMVAAASDRRDAAMLVFAMHTGCRISELLDLRLGDVNLETGECRVRIIKTKEEDVLRLSPTLTRYLREWMTFYCGRETTDARSYLFPARKPARLVGVRHASDDERGYNPAGKITSPGKYLKRMALDAGVPLETGDAWHTVRRSVARLFFDQSSVMGHDAALRMTSAFLHHKNTATTEIYLGLQLEKAKRDEVMSAGFLSDPAEVENVRSIDEFREQKNG